MTLLGVSGVDGAKFAKALESELSELYEFIPGSRYKRTAQQIGHLGASPADVMAVARGHRRRCRHRRRRRRPRA